MRVLLLCDDSTGNANTILDHIDAFRRFSRHEVCVFNPRAMKRSVALDLDDFDAVVIHYSLVLTNDAYVAPSFREKLKRYGGLKVQFLQDEYRWVDRITSAMLDIGVDVLFTVAPDEAAKTLYDKRLPAMRRVSTLTGYVPASLENRPLAPIARRPLDVAYRGRDVPFWLGDLGQEKAWIAQRFLTETAGWGLRSDVGWREEDRIYGVSWIDFIASATATLGTESGASITDFDGSIERAVDAYMRAHPDASYAEVHDAVLKPYEGNAVVKGISPRVFEAAALGTALVMFPGDYSGVVRPDVHYIALHKDFSNIGDVVARLRDHDFLARMIQRTHEDVVRSGRWSYRIFIAEFDDVLAQERKATPVRAHVGRYRLARLERALRVPPIHIRAARAVRKAFGRLRATEVVRRPRRASGSMRNRLSDRRHD